MPTPARRVAPLEVHARLPIGRFLLLLVLRIQIVIGEPLAAVVKILELNRAEQKRSVSDEELFTSPDVLTQKEVLDELKAIVVERLRFDPRRAADMTLETTLPKGVEGSLGLDSLDFIELSVAMEDRFGITIEEGQDLAEEFNSLFLRNAINNGLPAITVPEVRNHINEGDELTVHLSQGWLSSGDIRIEFTPLPRMVLDILDAGGLIPRLVRDGYLPEEQKAAAVR